MVVKRGKTSGTRKAPAKRGRPASSTAKKATPPKARGRQKAALTDYATKPPTDYHKAFAKWIVQEIGFDPNEASTKRAAFLMGVAISTATRPKFQQSDFLDEWREQSGVAKRGPKPSGKTRKFEATDPIDGESEEFEMEEDDDEDFEDEDDSDDDESEEDEDEDEDEKISQPF